MAKYARAEGESMDAYTERLRNILEARDSEISLLKSRLSTGDSSSSRSAFMDGLDAGLRDAPPSISFAAGQELARVLVKKATGACTTPADPLLQDSNPWPALRAGTSSATTSAAPGSRHHKASHAASSPMAEADEKGEASPQDGYESDGSMPPLEYVGAAPKAPKEAAPAPAPSSRSHVTPATATRSNGKAHDAGRVGASESRASAKPVAKPLHSPEPQAAADGKGKPFTPKVGDKVSLKGLNKAELNGCVAVVLTEASGQGRAAVKLEGTGQKLSVKLENLQPFTRSGAANAAEEEDSDDSMPPLEYVGGGSNPKPQKSQQPPQPSKPGAAVKKPSKQEEANDADSDDSMPPLEYVGPQSKKAADSHSMSNGKAPVPAPAPVVAPAPVAAKKTPSKEKEEESDDSMPPLEYVGTKASQPQKGSQPAPAGRASAGDAADADSDDSMPPLEYVGAKQQPQKANQQPQASGAARDDPDADSDDSMPPLEYVGKR